MEPFNGNKTPTRDHAGVRGDVVDSAPNPRTQHTYSASSTSWIETLWNPERLCPSLLNITLKKINTMLYIQTQNSNSSLK
jgi:hypothetical protein